MKLTPGYLYAPRYTAILKTKLPKTFLFEFFITLLKVNVFLKVTQRIKS